MRQAYTTEEVAERWNCTRGTIISMIKRGELSAFKIGKAYRIPIKIVQEHEECQQPTDLSEQEGELTLN